MRGRSPGWAVASLAIIGALSGCGGGALAGQSSASATASAPAATQTPVVVTQTVVVTDTVTVTVSAGASSASSTAASPATTSETSTSETTASEATTFTPHATPTSQPGGLPVADASQVVLAFLGSLEKNPSGSSSIQYLSQQLKAQVQGGRPIPSLLGVQNIYRAYHADAAVSRGGGRAATVRVTLTYASGPVQRLFTLVPEDGAWKIDDIAESNA
jgi:Flp pilus assembly protein TadD